VKRLVLVFCGLLYLATVHAASFNCAKANTAIEQMICANPEISDLDSELAEAFHLGANHLQDKSAFIRDQKHWLKSTRDACKDNACLRMVYIARLDVLQREPLPDQDSNDSEDIQFFAVNCDQPQGTLSVKGLDSIQNKGIEGGKVQEYIVNPEKLTEYTESEEREFHVPAGHRFYRCRLGDAQYKVTIAPNIQNANPQGECGAVSSDIALTVERNGYLLISELEFSHCRAAPGEHSTIEQVTISEPTKTIKVAAVPDADVLPVRIERSITFDALSQSWIQDIFSDKPTGDVDTDLFIAVHSRDIAAIKLALQNGANPNAKSLVGLPPLAFLVTNQGGTEEIDTGEYSRHTEKIARLLLSSGASPNADDGNGVTLLGYLVQSGIPNTVVELLLKKGANPKDEFALLAAAGIGNPHLVQSFLDGGASPNQKTAIGRSALWVAAVEGLSHRAVGHGAQDIGDYAKCIRLLMQHGAVLKDAADSESLPDQLVRLYGRDDRVRVILKELIPYMNHDEIMRATRLAEAFPGGLAQWLQEQMH
jgi:uncharacterized protein